MSVWVLCIGIEYAKTAFIVSAREELETKSHLEASPKVLSRVCFILQPITARFLAGSSELSRVPGR